jgi:hypothetical protein
VTFKLGEYIEATESTEGTEVAVTATEYSTKDSKVRVAIGCNGRAKVTSLQPVDGAMVICKANAAIEIAFGMLHCLDLIAEADELGRQRRKDLTFWADELCDDFTDSLRLLETDR